jgi:hypothetical protein
MSLFDVPAEVLNARPQGAKDFDFLQGRWLIHHKKLAERLVGSKTWHEFQTPAANQLILGGLGNVDQCRTESGDFWEGASLRLFDKASGLWRIYWMDTNGATLFPPLEGSFSGAVGLFRGHDHHNGTPVLVEFRWDKTTPEAPTWQQSFSADNGNSWEVNWYMSFSRRAAGSKRSLK